jgi:drug/metabolite transporter (DMT)-like permease
VSVTPHLLALAAAVSSALATVLIRQGLRHGNFYVGFWINVIVGMVGLWGAVLVLEPADAYRASAIPLFMLSGIIGTAGGRLLRFVSIEKVGAHMAASIINLNPFIATGLAILVLGERVTLPIIAGTGVSCWACFCSPSRDKTRLRGCATGSDACTPAQFHSWGIVPGYRIGRWDLPASWPIPVETNQSCRGGRHTELA